MPKKLNPRRHEEITRLRSAEELFKLIDNEKVLQDLGIRGVTWSRAEWDRRAMSAPYTPPSNILAARKHEVEYKGRDIESLMRYHETHKKPVGYWEDAPRGMKFGGSGARESSKTVTPTPASPALESGDDLYEPAGTLPVVGDRAQGGPDGTIGTVTRVDVDKGDMNGGNVQFDDGAANRFLDRFTGEDVRNFGILRILKRQPKAARGARAWKWRGGEGWNAVRMGDVTYLRYKGLWKAEPMLSCEVYMASPQVYPELPAPEAQRLWLECAAALNLNPETGEAK